MPLEYLHVIGNKLHSFRKRVGMTQADVAEKAGISDRTYADIERGTVNMRIDTVLRICKVLRITPDEILIAKEDNTNIECEEILKRMDLCSEKERRTALKILDVYLKSLE